MAQLKGGTYVGGELIVATDIYANQFNGSGVGLTKLPITIDTSGNSTYGGILRIGGNGDVSGVANISSIQTTDGNLHLDAGVGKKIYLNYYQGSGINFGSGTLGINATLDSNGSFTTKGNIITNFNGVGNYTECTRFNLSTGGWAAFMLGGPNGSTSGTDANTWGLFVNGSNFRIARNSSSENAGLDLKQDGTAKWLGNNLITAGNIASQSVNSSTFSFNLSQTVSVTGRDPNVFFTETNAGQRSYAEGSNTIGAANPGGTWWFYENIRHTNGTNLWGRQYAHGWEDNANRLLVRNVSAGVWSTWYEFITTKNIATQSVAYAANSGTVVHAGTRTDTALYNILWGVNAATTQLYSCNAIQIQSSTGTIFANMLTTTGNITTGGRLYLNCSGGTAANFIMTGAGEQGIRMYNTNAAGNTNCSIKFANRLNSDWRWIMYTDDFNNGTDDFSILNRAGYVLYANTTGKVGFGTQTLIERLNVNGGVNATGVGKFGDDVTSTNGGITTIMSTNSSGGYGIVGTATTHPLMFIVNGTNQMTINTLGRVLIGSTIDNTVDKLQVTGTLKATGYKSSDGSAGITTTLTFKDLLSVSHTLTFKNGLLTAIS